MNQTQANDYVKNIGLDNSQWIGCRECGSCQGKKIKCRKGDYELHLIYPRGRYNLFLKGKNTKGGLISNIVSELAEI